MVVCTWAEASSVSMSGAQSKHRERFAFQHESRQTQCVHLGHWWNLGLVSSMAVRNALSCADPRMPPKIPPAVRNALTAKPVAEALNSVMKPLPQRSQKNSNWYPLSVEWSVWFRVNWISAICWISLPEKTHKICLILAESRRTVQKRADLSRHESDIRTSNPDWAFVREKPVSYVYLHRD